MAEYDLKRLEVAIQYINRMVSGRNPVTNRPAPENEVLTNPNVNRCLQFVSEILTEVKSTGGVVGKPSRIPRAPKAPKPSIAETFPYEILQGYHFERDQQISYFLKQLAELLPEEGSLGVQATLITDWLRENGYLEKTFMQDISKETTIPTQKGGEIGIYAEKAGLFPNEYYRIFYNEKAQLFLIENFRKILSEGTVLRERLKKERKEQKEQQKEQQKGRGKGLVPAETGSVNPAEKESANPVEKRPADSAEKGPADPGVNAGRGRTYGTIHKRSSIAAPDRGSAAAAWEEDPAFLSLLNSIPQDDGFMGAQDDGFMEDGWESADEGIPW